MFDSSYVLAMQSIINSARCKVKGVETFCRQRVTVMTAHRHETWAIDSPGLFAYHLLSVWKETGQRCRWRDVRAVEGGGLENR